MKQADKIKIDNSLPRPEKNDYIEADIDDWGYEGEGIAHIGSVPIFIKNAIKGEHVRAKIIFDKKNYYFAVIDKILRASGHRVKPPCVYFGKCGGCDLQHVDYRLQTEIKRGTLLQTLKKQVKSELNVSKTTESDKCYSYRNKLILAVRGNAPELGFFAKNSHRIVGIKNCLLQSFDAQKIIELFTRFMNENALKAYDEIAHSGDIKHLAVRQVDGRLIIAVVTLRPLKTQLKALDSVLKKEYGENYVLYSNLNDSKTNVIFSDRFEFVGGNEAKLQYFGMKLFAHPAAFFQVNDYVAKLVYGYVCDEIKSAEKSVVIDAYAGAGTLSVLLSRAIKKVYSVELNTQAHIAAKELCKDNNIDNVECINADCKIAVPAILRKQADCAAVVLDPPRTGCAREVIDALIDAQTQKIIYISCNPATLARDLSILEKYYYINIIRPFDMFPQTANLETVTVLSRRDI